MIANDIYDEVSGKLGIDKKIVKAVYDSYWYKIKDRISDLEPNNITSKEQLDNMSMSFSIPFLGKFYVDYNIINAYKKSRNDYKEN